MENFYIDMSNRIRNDNEQFLIEIFNQRNEW